jgi:ABC-type uncharacterized transport system permease subunit
MTGTTETLHAPTRGRVEEQLELLKQRLLRPVIDRVSDTALVKELAWAANEAAALAWMTVCPILVLPALLEEKIQEATRKWEKQEQIRQR